MDPHARPHDHHGAADSAGVPWAGRRFEANDFASDNGSTPGQLAAAMAEFRSGARSSDSVVDALRGARLLIPLVARLDETGVSDTGLVLDKSAELSMVTVAGPDGRAVIPVFSSVEAMARWNPDARPVPSEAVRVALAAASEQIELVVLDPGGDGEFVVRRPAVWAVAQSSAWVPSHRDPEVADAFATSIAGESAVVAFEVVDGDPTCRLLGPELLVILTLRPGLDPFALRELTSRLESRWSSDAVIAERVDSMAVRLAVAR